MSARAKPKRRGHVQQYSTGGGNGSDTGQANPSARVPVAPPLATLPRPNATLSSAFSGNSAIDLNSPSLGPQNGISRAPAPMSAISPYSAISEQLADPLLDEHRDPWDEEIGEIPWEDDVAPEPSQETQKPQELTQESLAANANQYDTNPPAEPVIDSGAGPVDDVEEDLEELPWDEEDDLQHSQQSVPEPPAQNSGFPFSHRTNNSEDVGLPWEQPQKNEHWAENDGSEAQSWDLNDEIEPQAESRLPWENNAESDVREPVQDDFWEHEQQNEEFIDESESGYGTHNHFHEQSQHEGEEEYSHEHFEHEKPVEEYSHQDFEQEEHAEEYGHEHFEQEEKYSHEQVEQENPAEEYSHEHFEEDTPAEDYSHEQFEQENPVEEYSQQNFAQNEPVDEYSHQHFDQETPAEWDSNYNGEHEEKHAHFNGSNEQEIISEETSGLPWERKASGSFRSHKSFLDSDEPQALSIQKSDHPSEVASHAGDLESLSTEIESWMNDNQAGASQDQKLDSEKKAFEQKNRNSIPGVDSLLPAAEVEPSSQANDASEWEDQPTENSIQHSEGLSIQYNPTLPDETKESHNVFGLPQQPVASSQTPWPSVNENTALNVDTEVNQVQSYTEEDAGANQEVETGERLFVENSDVPSFDLSHTDHKESNGIEEKRSKALELLDLDDDLLLDDDFLEDEPELAAPVVPEVPKTVENPAAPKTSFASKYSKPAEVAKPISQYTPQATVPRSAFVPPPSSNLIPSKVTQEPEVVATPDTRKNDAYDFPVEFSTQKPKPAARAPSTSILSRNTTPAVAPAPSVPNVPSQTIASAGPSTNHKPFFEDLPVSLPKPANKSKRAAPAAISASPKIPQPPALTQEPAKALPIKSPKNPYASLAPKVGLAAQQPQVPGVPDRAGAPSKYQPAGGPAVRPPQKGSTPVPMKAGVLPPPGINLPTGNRQMPGGSQTGNNLPQVPTNQYAPAPAPVNQYAPAPAPVNQYAPAPAPAPVNQYAPSTLPQQHGQFQNPQNGPVMPPNQFAPSPLPQQHGQFQNSQNGSVMPQNQYAPAPLPQQHGQTYQTGPPSQYAPAPLPQQHGPGQSPQHAQANIAQPLGQDIPAPPANRAPRLNTNVTKNNEKNSSLSPYVPNAGPYGPSARTHSRTSSLIGGNAKEGNPYAPANQGVIGSITSPNHAVAPLGLPVVRKRGKSNARSNLPTISQVAEKVENPEALLRRQFPIFRWGPSDQASSFIPQPGNGFELPQRIIRVAKVSDIVPSVEVYPEFPGPLSRSKTKRKDIEAWLEKNIAKLRCDLSKPDELLINELLYALVQNDGEFASLALHKKWASILTPNVDFAFTQDPNSGFRVGGGLGTSANAFKLDNAGVNTVWSLVQAGNRAGALNYAISKQDWAFAFIIAQSLGQETFSKVCSDYARISFPFQTNQNTRVQHLMPLLLKIFVGNTKSVIDDFTNVPSEAEFAKSHYREILSAAIINGASTEFLVEFGNFLGKSGLVCASEVCFLLAGLILSRVPLQNGAVFWMIGSFTPTSVYSEVYEYVLSMSSISSASIPPTGLPDLLSAKIKRAQVLADMGHFAASRKYCDHIGSVMKTLGKSPFVTPNVSTDFKSLLVRLSDCSSSESGWLGTKLSKVNLDKVWGQLDKFIGGDEPSAKTGEKGVFSKFSPNISRKSSMLDVTSIGFHRSESFVGPPQLTSAPPTEFSSPSQRQGRHAAPQKYAPTQPQVVPQASLVSPQIPGPGKSGATGAPFGRHHQKLGSSSSINLLDSNVDHRPEGLPSNSHSVGQKHNLNPRKQMYANRAAQLSSSSIVSQNATNHGVGAGVHSPARSVASVARHNEHLQEPAFPTRSVNGHSRTSSHQSGPYEPSLSPLPQRHESKSSLEKEEFAPGPNELPVKASEYQSNASEGDAASVSSHAEEKEAVPEAGSTVGEDTEANTIKEETPTEASPEVPGPPPPPPVSTSKVAGPKKANPYAPNDARRNNKGSNRYGPGASTAASSNNRYRLEPKSTDENFTGTASGTPFSGVLDTSEQTEDNAPIDDAKTDDVPEEKEAPSREVKAVGPEDHPSETASQLPPPPPPPPSGINRVPKTPVASKRRVVNQGEKRNPYAPAAKPVPTNVDTSFDVSNQEDPEDHIDEPRAPLILNAPASPPSNFRPGFVNPYQEGKKANADLPIQNGFDEFPIPGSPEYTTRANSVIGHTGLYSSRLSQSQQSALYQQYEVKDDTVLDYVPVPEENEDDDAEASKKEARRKKDMADAKNKIQEEMSRRGGGENAESGWFKGWLGNKKNDDKPKPIRAKLGKANTFKYDEKHKRWIDTSRPLEEQLKEAAPPPPPKKKIQAEKPQGEAPAIATPAPARGPSAVPNTIGGRRASVTKTPSKAAPEPSAPRPNLANAGLDDLLNLNPSNKGPASAAGRRGKRRYVNVMETK